MPTSSLPWHVLTLVLLAKHAVSLPIEPYKFQIWFTFQSQANNLATWFVMLTLCLAPLGTHIVFGLPEPVILRENDPLPTWTDRMTLLNPISILWRYYAIAERRLRTRNWDPLDLAAVNAGFWNGKRWDGSEQIMMLSQKWNVKHLEKSHTGIISGSFVATAVITLQGI